MWFPHVLGNSWGDTTGPFDHWGRHIFGNAWDVVKRSGAKPVPRASPPIAAIATGMGGTECGGSRFGNTPPRRIGQQASAATLNFCLIRRHPLGCVAFHVFDRAEVFLGRLFDILHSHIVLIIQPRPRLTRNSP